MSKTSYENQAESNEFLHEKTSSTISHIGSNDVSTFAEQIERKQTFAAQHREMRRSDKQATICEDEELLLASNIESLYQDPLKEVTSYSNDLILNNPSPCSIYHLIVAGYHMQGKGKTIQANPSEFEWLFWNPKSSGSPLREYFVFGKEIKGSMKYMTYEKNSKVLRFLSFSEIDVESTDQDPRLFYWEGNSLVSAASTSKLHVCLNSNTYNVEVSDIFQDEWGLSVSH